MRNGTRRCAIRGLEAAFKSFRLNLPAGDESTMLLTIPEWGQSPGP